MMAPSWAVAPVLAALLTAAAIAAPLSINAGSTTGTVTLPAGTYDYVTVRNIRDRVVVGTDVVSNGAFTVQGTSTAANMGASQISLTNCSASAMTVGYITGSAASLKLQGVHVTGSTRLFGVSSSADVVSVKQSTMGPLTVDRMRGVRNGFVMTGNTITCTSSMSCVYFQRGYVMGTATVAGLAITGNTVTASCPFSSTTCYGLDIRNSEAAKMIVSNNNVTMTHGRTRCLSFGSLASLSTAPLQLAITHNELRATNTTGTASSVVGIAFPGVFQSSRRPPIDIRVQHNVIEALSNSGRTVGVFVGSTMKNAKLSIGVNQMTVATMSGSAYATHMEYGFRASPLLNISGNAITVQGHSSTVYGISLPSRASSSSSSSYGVRQVAQVLLNDNTIDLTVAQGISDTAQAVSLNQMREVDSLQVSGNTIGIRADSVYALNLYMHTYSEVKAVEVRDNTVTADCTDGVAVRMNAVGTQSLDMKGNTAIFERVTNSSVVALQVQFRGAQATRSTNAVAVQNNVLRGVTGGILVQITYLSQFHTLDLGGNQWAAVPAAPLTSSSHTMYYLASVSNGSTIRFADERVDVCSSTAVCGSAYGVHIDGEFSHVDSLVFDNVDFGVSGSRRGVGIYVTSSFTTGVGAVSVKNCRFYVNTTDASGTSASDYSGGLLMQGNMSNLDALEVVNNTVTRSHVPVGGGLLVGASVNTQLRSITRLAITGNTVTMTSASSLAGIRLTGQLLDVSSMSVADNIVTLTQPTGSGIVIGLETVIMVDSTRSALEVLRNSIFVTARTTAYGMQTLFSPLLDESVDSNVSAAGVSGTVVDNVVNVQGTTSTGTGLQVGLHGLSSGADGTLLVQRNNVTVTMTTGSATALGVERAYDLATFTIEDNTVHAAGGDTLHGLHMEQWYHCHSSIVQGNRMTTRHTNQQNPDGSTYGLYVGSSTYAMQQVELLENMVDIEGASAYTVSGIHFGSSIHNGGNWTWRGNNVTVVNRYRYSVASHYSGKAYSVYIRGYVQHMRLLQLQGNTFTTLAGSAAYGVYLYSSSSSSSFRSNVSELAIIDNAFYQGCVVARTSPSAKTYGVNANMLMRDVGAFTVTGNLFTNVLPEDSPFGTNSAVMRSSSAAAFVITRTMYNVSCDISHNTVELYARSTVTGITATFEAISRELRVGNNTLRLRSTRSSVDGVQVDAEGDSSHRFGNMLVDRNTMELDYSDSGTAVSVTGSYFDSVDITENAVVAARSPTASTAAMTAFYAVAVGRVRYCKHLRLEGNHMNGTGVAFGRGVSFGTYSYAGVLVRSNTFLISSPALAASRSTAMQTSAAFRSDTVISNNTFVIYGGESTGLSVMSSISYGSFHVHENRVQLYTMYPSRRRFYGMTFSFITSTEAFVVSNNSVALRAQLLSGEDRPLASQPYTAIGVYFDNDVDQNKAVGVVSNTIDVLCGRYAVSGIELGDTVDHVYNKTLNHTLYNVTGDGTLSFSDNEINVRTPTTAVTYGVRFTSIIRYIAQGLVVSGNRMTCNNSATGGFHGVSVYGRTLATVALLEVAGNRVESHVATSYGVHVRSSMTAVVARVRDNRLTHYRRARAASTVHGVYFTGSHTSCTVEVEGNTIDAAATEADRCTGRGVALTGSDVQSSRYHIAGNNITHASPAATSFHGVYFGGASTDTDNLYNITGNAVTITAQRAAAGVLTQRRFGLRTTVEISSNTLDVTTVQDNAVGIRIEGELEDTLIIARNRLVSTAGLTSAFGIVVAALGRNSSTPRASGVPALLGPALLAVGSAWIVTSNEVMSRGAGSAAFTVSARTLQNVNIVAEGNRFAADGPRDPQPSTTARVWTAPVQVNSTRLTTALVWFQKNVIAAMNKTAADCVLQLPEAMGSVNATLRANEFMERETPLLLARSTAAPVSLPVDFAFVCNYFGGEPLVNRSLVEPRLPAGATLVMRCGDTNTVSPRVTHSATATQTRPLPPTRTLTVPDNDTSSSSSSAAAASSVASGSSPAPPPPVMSSSFSPAPIPGASSSRGTSAPAADSSSGQTTPAPFTPAPTSVPASSAPAAPSSASSAAETPAPPGPASAPAPSSSNSAVAPTAAPTTPAPAPPRDSSQGSASKGVTAVPTPQPSPAPTPEPSTAPTPAPERTLTIQETPPPVLPAAVTESAEAIGTAVAGVGALLASPAAAAQLARAVAVLDLAELCGNGQLPHVSKLSFSSSPLGIGIGPDIGRYYRGAVIGNIALGLVLTAVVTLAVFITSKLPCATNAPRHRSGDPHSPWLRACGFWRYPSCLVVGLAFLLDGTVYGALAGALHGDPSTKGLDVVLCAMVMLGLVALFAGLGYFHIRGPTMHLVHFVPEERDLKGASLPRRAALFFGGACGHWVVRPTSLSPDDSSRQRMWALLFTWYRAPMHRFLLIDLGATALIAILRSIPPDHCVPIVWGMTAINAAVLAAAAAMRPYNVPLKTMLLVGTCVVTVAASGLVAIALREDPATEGLITAAADLAVMAMYLVVVNVIVSVVRRAYKMFHSCRSKDSRNAPFASEFEAVELRTHGDFVGVRELVDGKDLLAAADRGSPDSGSPQVVSRKPLDINVADNDDPAAVFSRPPAASDTEPCETIAALRSSDVVARSSSSSSEEHRDPRLPAQEAELGATA